MRVSIVGLGPGPSEWITAAALARLRTHGIRVFVRTRLFPGLDSLLDGIQWASFDALYESLSSIDAVHAGMVERLLACDADVVLAVPGDGNLGEAVLERLQAAGATVEVVPGISLGIGALAASAMGAADGAQFVEATSLGGSGIDLHIELNPRWPAVVTGVFNPRVATDLKLALQRVYPAEHALTLVAHPGLADERVEHLALADLDRGRLEYDHLTHVVLAAVIDDTPTGSMHSLRALVARLRAPEIGCP